MSKKDDVLSAMSSFINALADYTAEVDGKINNLEQENKELRERNAELAGVFRVGANILTRGDVCNETD